MDPELEQKIGEIEKMSESQVDERLQAMLVSGQSINLDHLEAW